MPKINLALRIRDFIVSRIEDGSWKSGDRILSESELMDRFSASRMTVHRAVKELAAEGRLVRERGRGTFVAERIPRSSLLQVTDISDEIIGRGGSYFCQVVTLAPEPKSPLTEHVFGPEAAARIARSRIIHFENSIPLQLEDRWVDLETAPGYLDADFTRITTHRYLNQTAPLHGAEHELTAVLPDARKQEYLHIRADEPCLLLKRKTWSGDRLVSYAELLYPGSRYSFGGAFTPGETAHKR